MRKSSFLVHTLLLALSLALGFPTRASAEDVFQVIHVDGKTSGTRKSTTREIEENGEKRIETADESVFKLARMGTEISISQSTTTVENAEGKIVRLRSSQNMAQNETVYEGVVVGDKMNVTTTTAGKPRQSTIAWKKDVPGPEEVKRRLVGTGFAPGAKLVVTSFDFTLGGAIDMTYTIEGSEEVQLPNGTRKLHRIKVKSGVPGLPDSLTWVDDTGERRKESVSMVGVKIETLDATREQFVDATGQRGAEVFNQSMIQSNMFLEHPRKLVEVVYDIRQKDGGGTPELPSDSRQSWVGDGDAKHFKVSFVAPKDDGKAETSAPPTTAEFADFLAPNPLIQSDDEKIIAFAKQAVGDERNAWRAAKKLESAVFAHIKKKNMGVGFASALETFETCEGDCSEHAVLLAACCRAVGIPSRVAMGLVYINQNDVGLFGGHAWVDVAIDGDWYGLDATLGVGGADPTHIRMSAASLKDGGLQDALVGIANVLGQVDLTIISAK